MNYLDLLNKLSKIEQSYQEDSIIDLIKNPDEFEEIPLITRVGREQAFLTKFSKKDLNLLFLNTAIFYLNNIKLIAKNHLNEDELNALFFCITYPDVNDELYGFYVPNLCITKIKYKQSIENNPLLNLDNTMWLNNALNELGFYHNYKIVYSKFDDGFGNELMRIFLLNQ